MMRLGALGRLNQAAPRVLVVRKTLVVCWVLVVPQTLVVRWVLVVPQTLVVRWVLVVQ
jgi:hypothetical protein